MFLGGVLMEAIQKRVAFKKRTGKLRPLMTSHLTIRDQNDRVGQSRRYLILVPYSVHGTKMKRLTLLLLVLARTSAAQMAATLDVTPQDGWSVLKDFLSSSGSNQAGEDPFLKIQEHGKKAFENIVTSVSQILQESSPVTSSCKAQSTMFNNDVEEGDDATCETAETEGIPLDPTEKLLSKILGTVTYKEEPESIEQALNVLWTTFNRAQKQLEKTFQDLSLSFHPLQMYYFMLEAEAQLHHPIFKRRQHAFMNPVPESVLHALSDGLYLSHLSYVDDCDQIGKHLKDFHNNSWGMMNCTTTSKPSQPAHFVAIRKVSKASWETLRPQNIMDRISDFFNDNQGLEVAIVVRGTKEISDILSDALLEAVDYRGGKSHNGIMDSAMFLKETYEPVLENLLNFTGQSKMKLWIIGHSLGGGTAALTALEFLEHERIDAHAVGFGTPAVVSKQIEYPKNIITTVVNDADCVPRLSGSTMVSTAVKLDGFPWLKKAKEDLLFLKKQKLPFKELTDSLIDKLLATLETEEPASLDDINLPEQVLIPPGNCIHMYRDNLNWQAVYMDCELFDSIETVRNMLGDHLIPTGYYKGLLENLRRLRQDINYVMEPNLMDLPIPPPPSFVA